MLTPRTWADLRAAIAKEAYYTTELVGPPPAPSRESPAAYDQAPGKVTFMLIWDGESQRPRPMLARPDPVAERFRVLNPEVGQVEFVRVLDPEPVVYRRRQHAGGAPGFPTPVSSGATGLKNLTTAAIMKPKTAGVANGSPVGASQPGVTSEQQPAATTAAEGHADKALSQADEATPDAGKNGAPAAPQTTPAPAASEPDPKMVAALEAAQLRAAVLLHGALVSLVPAQNPLGPHDTGKGLCVLVELPARILHANDDDDKLQVKKDEELTGWARIVGMRNTLGLDWRLVEAALASVPWGPASRDEALVLKQMEKSAMVFQAKLEAEKSRDEKPGENATEKSVAGANTEAEVGQNEVDVKKEEQHEKQLGSRADVVDADADPSAKGKVKESGSELEPDPKPDPKTAVAMNTGRALKEGTIRFQLVFGLWNWEDDDSFA